MIPISDIELIEKYLEGSLQGEELSLFNQRLDSEPELAEHLEDYKLAIEGVKAYQQGIMKRQLRKIHHEIFMPPVTRFLSTWYGLSSSVLILAGLVFGIFAIKSYVVKNPNQNVLHENIKEFGEIDLNGGHSPYLNNSALTDENNELMTDPEISEKKSNSIVQSYSNKETEGLAETYSDQNSFNTETFFNPIKEKKFSASSLRSGEIPVIKFGASNKIGCVPLQVSFFDSSIVTDGHIDSFRWDFGDGGSSSIKNPVHLYNTNGVFSVSLKVWSDKGESQNLTKHDFIIANIVPKASFNTKPEYAVINVPSFEFINKTLYETPGTKYKWDFGDNSGISDHKNPVYTYTDTGTFKVTLLATNEYNCSSTFVNSVTIYGEVFVFIPDAFSPDGKGPHENDIFKVSAIGIKKFELYIHNRYGDLIYQSSNFDTHGWDGKGTNGSLQPSGVYICTLRIIGIDDKVYDYTKPINLIR